MTPIATALHDVRAIWRVTVLQSAAGAERFMRSTAWLLLFVALILSLVLWRHERDWLWPRVMLGIATFWLALTWAMLFLPGSILLNSVANARLLPRQRRRLRQMAGGGFLILTLSFTIVAGTWTALPMIGIYVIGVALLGAGNRRVLVPVVLAANWLWLSRFVLPPPLAEATGSTPFLLGLTLLLVPAGAWALRWLYPAGGDAHFARRSLHIKHMTRFEGRNWSQQAESSSPVLRLYGAALRRDGRRADPGRLLLHALGPAVHWSAWVNPVLLMLAAGAGVRLLLAWRGASSGYLNDFMEGFALPGLGVLTMTILLSTAQFGQSLGKTRGEQALLRLAPRTGGPALLNRHLAGCLLRDALRLWAVLTLTILFVSAAVGGAGVLPRQLALCCLAGQVAMTGLLGDYAGSGGWNLRLALRAALLAVLQAAVAVMLDWVSGVPTWLWVVAFSLGMTVFQLHSAWGAMLGAAPAFPARRMS
jgi:hypothetical protein